MSAKYMRGIDKFKQDYETVYELLKSNPQNKEMREVKNFNGLLQKMLTGMKLKGTLLRNGESIQWVYSLK